MSFTQSVSQRAKHHLRPAGTSAAIAIAVLLMTVGGAAAQTDRPAGRIRLAGVYLTPAVSLANVGLESNVFNASEAPLSDFTGTLQPSLDAATRIGALNISWAGRGDLSYFRRFSDQGTAGGSHRIQFDLPINRVRLFAVHRYLNAKERPTPEIDIRVRRREQAATAGAELVLSALTRLTVSLDTGLVRFDQSASARGLLIARALDRQTDRAQAAVTHAITPLTSVTAGYSHQRERFLGDELRNNTNRRAVAGVAFQPFALLSGRVEAGVLEFVSDGGRVAGLRAPAYSADLGYVFKGRTQVGVRGDRSVSYSIDDASAYYLQTSYGSTLTHALTDALFVSVAATRQRLAHQLTGVAAPIGEPVAPLTRIEAIDTGIGFNAASGVSWSLHGIYVTREPVGGTLVTRFENLRVFLTVSYGATR